VQREQWRRDNIKTETRELLVLFNALVPAYTGWVRTWHGKDARGPIVVEGTEVKRLLDTYTDRSVAFHSALRDRLFIYAQVRSSHLDKMWARAMTEFEESLDEQKLADTVGAINTTIVNIALK
jgi:hypothetical protein